MNRTIRKLSHLKGRLPPAARFNVTKQGRAYLSFNLQTSERFGIGTEYRSANLHHVQDHDNNTENLLLELFTEPEKGRTKLRLFERNLTTKIGITTFLREFDVPFQQGVRYPVWMSGKHLYVDLTPSLAKSA